MGRRMKNQFLTRRNFLKSFAAAGIGLTLASSPWPPTTLVHAQQSALIPVPKGLEVLKLPAVQSHMAAGKGSLWVSGRFLNSFRNNLLFENLPTSLKSQVPLRRRRIQELSRGTRSLGECSRAGESCRPRSRVEVPQRQGLVSHRAPRSGGTGDSRQRCLVELYKEQEAGRNRNERGGFGRCQSYPAV